jgi:hypothetical protein
MASKVFPSEQTAISTESFAGTLPPSISRSHCISHTPHQFQQSFISKYKWGKRSLFHQQIYDRSSSATGHLTILCLEEKQPVIVPNKIRDNHGPIVLERDTPFQKKAQG